MSNVLGGANPDLVGSLGVVLADLRVRVHLYGKSVKPGRKVGHVTVCGDDPAATADAPARRPTTWRGERMPDQPLVGVVMGSDSRLDWPTIEVAAAALTEFGVPYEADAVSAHRMPEEMVAYGRTAREG